MNKPLLYTLITIGGTIGGYLPTLLGASGFSIWAIIGSTIGGIAGIVVAVKISN